MNTFELCSNIESKLNELDEFLNKAAKSFRQKGYCGEFEDFDYLKNQLRLRFYWLKSYLPNDYMIIIDSIIKRSKNVVIVQSMSHFYVLIRSCLDDLYLIENGDIAQYK